MSKIEPKIEGADLFWDCKREDGINNYTVQLYGDKEEHISLVTIGAMYEGSGDTKEVISEYLTDMAVIAYKKPDSTKVQKWINDNMTTDAKTVIEGVDFSFYGQKSATYKLLRIGTVQ